MHHQLPVVCALCNQKDDFYSSLHRLSLSKYAFTEFMGQILGSENFYSGSKCLHQICFQISEI